MKKLAVFLEPVGGLRDELLRLKQRVRGELAGQPYCDHPPHSTVIVAWYRDAPELRASLRGVCAETGPLTIDGEGMMVFHDDRQTGGGHTVAVRVKLSDPLRSLQERVALALAPFRVQPPVGAEPDVTWGEPMRGSLERFGFPFVGAHWIPHFTIASLRVERSHPLLQELAAARVAPGFTALGAALWEIRGENHARLDFMPFRQAVR